MLKLYHWEPNANIGKPMLALKEKGVEFESHFIDLQKFEHHSPEYLAINPLGVIPAAIHDGRNLYESTAIMEYVDAAFDGPPLRPADPVERWRMRWWIKFADEYHAPSISMTAWSRGRIAEVGERDEEALRRRIEAIPQKERQVSWSKALFGTFSPEEMAESDRRVAYGAGVLEQALGRSEWLAGDSYSLADMAVFCHCYMVPARPNAPVNDVETPRLMAWLRKIAARPAVIETWKMGRMWNLNRLAHLLPEGSEASAR